MRSGPPNDCCSVTMHEFGKLRGIEQTMLGRRLRRLSAQIPDRRGCKRDAQEFVHSVLDETLDRAVRGVDGRPIGFFLLPRGVWIRSRDSSRGRKGHASERCGGQKQQCRRHYSANRR